MSTAPIDTDVLIVGAGPAGLFAAFEFGLLEVRTQIVDSLPEAGGQCVELYGDKPIYDIPGLPVCSGRELIGRLLKQIEPFGVPMHLGREVASLQVVDGGFVVGTEAGVRWRCRALVIAAGVGSFQPRLPAVDNLGRFRGTQVFHRADDVAACRGCPTVVIGGDRVAIDAALRLASDPASPPVTLLHRREVFDADDAALSRLQAARASGRIRFVAGQVGGLDERDGRMAGLRVALSAGGNETIDTTRLLVLLGLSPKLGPIAGWGLQLQRKQIVVDVTTFQTSVAGVHAIGDVVAYPGKKKLIVCGFHEATMAAFAIAERLNPGSTEPLQYTTSSPKLQRLLGVSGR